MSDFDQFRDTFFEECDELLQRYEEIAGALTRENADVEGLNEMFRAIHSIKAGAGAFGFERLVKFSHTLENAMDMLRDGRLSIADCDPAVLVQAGDVMHLLVGYAKQGEDTPAPNEDQLLAALSGFGAGSEKAISELNPDELEALFQATPEDDFGESPIREYAIEFRPHRQLYEGANEPQLLIQALADLGELSVSVDTSRIPEINDLDPFEGYLSWSMVLRGQVSRSDIEEVFEFVEGDADIAIKLENETAEEQVDKSVTQADIADAPVSITNDGGVKKQAASKLSTIRVDLNRVDELVNMVGELVIAQAMALESLGKSISIDQVRELQAMEDLSMRMRQLQEGVMAIRMQPLKALFSRFPRIVRDLSQKLEKSAVLELEGELTEVDKTIIEELADPLTHMIRNCMDHGLETAEERAAVGKPETGVITLSAEHRAGRIYIRVSDDGRGLDPVKVRAKALSQGIISEHDKLSREEMQSLIFQPGFSTASEISDVSGRGVGMDVVRRNVQKLGGRVTVESEEGKGSCFTLTLPLTLAVLDGMLVAAAKERYVIPLSSIVETVCPDPKQIKKMPDGGSVLSLRGEAIRLIDLCACLSLSRVGVAEPLRKLVIIAETELGRPVGIIVDEMLGQQQVVIKNLENNYRRVPGVSGSAILGDGRVRLILDVDALADMTPERNELKNIHENKDLSSGDGEQALLQSTASGGLS